MMARVSIIGRLGKDPKQNAGATAVFFSVATEEKKGETIWFECAAFGQAGGFVLGYCKKGDQVFVEGSLATREYKDKEGQIRVSLSIAANAVRKLSGQARENESDKPQHAPSEQAPPFNPQHAKHPEQAQVSHGPLNLNNIPF